MTQHQQRSLPDIPETATKQEVARLRLEVQLEQIERRWREAQEKHLGFGKHGTRYKPAAWRALLVGGVMAFFGLLFLFISIYSLGRPDVKWKDGTPAMGIVFGILFGGVGLLIAIFGSQSETRKAAALESARVQYENEKRAALAAIEELK